MDGSAESGSPPQDPSAHATAGLARALGISDELAQRLVGAGYSRPEAVRDLPDDELSRLGLDERQRAAVHGRPASAPSEEPMERPTASADSERIVEKWVGSVQRTDRGRRRRVAPAATNSAEVLKKWVEGDDRAMEEWIRSSDRDRPAPAGPAPAPSVPTETEGGSRPRAPEAPPSGAVGEREETVVRWLTGLLDRVKSDQFDPSSLIQEGQDLQRQLYDERAKRKQLEDQVEHVKRGSIAVIKYVRSRESKERETAVRAKDEEIAELQAKLYALARPGAQAVPGAPAEAAGAAGAAAATAEARARSTAESEQHLREEFSEREHEYVERETELRRRIVQLESDVRRLTSEVDSAKERAALSAKPSASVDQELSRRLDEVGQRQRDLVARENELRTKFEEIRLASEEIERRRGPLEFKERELAAYDQQMQSRRQALDIEARRLEEIRKEMGAPGVAKTSAAQRLEDMRHELSKKEAELRGREAQLQERLREVERLAGTAAETEAARLHAESVASAEAPKVKSGVRRLDDLLFGGFPPGVQLLLNGPAHTGKDVLARLFSVEGLRSGVPSIWVITDKTYSQVRDDLAALYPAFPDAEKKGMLRYVDLYSRAVVGSASSTPGVRLLSSTDKAVLDQLGQAVNGYAEELKEHFPTYRLIFESVSTITAYMDTAATFRFLQPFTGRRKLDGAVGYYVLDSGMHSEADLETLEHILDGSLSLKVEQMKTFLAARGIGDAQARTWIGYTFTKNSFNLGSFSLEHIR
jgi:KaiC/GvpD/RAD55 family RecA-like ATPase